MNSSSVVGTTYKYFSATGSLTVQVHNCVTYHNIATNENTLTHHTHVYTHTHPPTPTHTHAFSHPTKYVAMFITSNVLAIP